VILGARAAGRDKVGSVTAKVNKEKENIQNKTIIKLIKIIIKIIIITKLTK
jgi:hypothetical protein